MLNAQALREIDGEVLNAAITGYAKRGFSGDLNFQREGWQVVWSHTEFFTTEPFVGIEAVNESLVRNGIAFIAWTETDGGTLHVSMHCGKITRVRVSKNRELVNR
jgi:hypothetical protein